MKRKNDAGSHIVSGVFMIGFGLVWTALAAQASPLFALFGVLWIGLAVTQMIRGIKQSREQSDDYDMVNDVKELDPWDARYQRPLSGGQTDPEQPAKSLYCPYCGTPVLDDFAYCNRCGKKLP